MKISFSTLGCPGWSWNEILITAKDLGYNGIEIRGVGNEVYVPRAKPFLPNQIHSTKNHLQSIGLEISCLTSSCYLHKEETELYMNEGKEYVELAKSMDVPFVRVLGDSEAYPQGPVNFERVVDGLNKLAAYAFDKGVTILIETNGAFANSNLMLKLMNRISHPNVGVLWDIHHPFRFIGEDVETTYLRLRQHIKYVHVKDSRMENGVVKYCVVGQGEIPLEQVCKMLQRDGYKGYLALEWIKRWCYDLEEPGIIFPRFIHTIRELLK